jgi:hypothetical protein
MHPQPFDDPDLNDDEDDAVPFAFSKIRLGLGRRAQSERHLSRPFEPFNKDCSSASEEKEADAPRPSATATSSSKEHKIELTSQDASKIDSWRAVPSATDDGASLDRTGSDHVKILKHSKELLHIDPKDDPAQPKTSSTGSGAPLEVIKGGDSSVPCSHTIAALLQAAMDGDDARSETVTSDAERGDQKDNELKVLALREFTKSLSQRAIARTSFRPQGSSMSITSECGSVVSGEGEAAHATKKKRRSRKITRSQSMIDVMPPSVSAPTEVVIEYDFDDSGMEVTDGMRRTKDPDGADPVRSPIKRSRSLHRSASAVFSSPTLSKSLHLPGPSRGRQAKSPPSASKESRRSVQRSLSLQPKSRGEGPVSEQRPPSTTRKPVRRSNSSESLSSLSNRSQLSLKRSDFIGVLSCTLDGSVPVSQPGNLSLPKNDSDRSPPSRTLQRSKSIQPTSRPKLDPPGALSTASYVPSENPLLASTASEQTMEARQLVMPPSVSAENASTRKVKRSQSLQLMKRSPPTSEKTKGKTAAKSTKRGHGSVSFVESPFPLELDDGERVKSHSSSSSRTSCSTAGTATSSSQSSDDYDDIDGAAAAADAEAALNPLAA